MKSLERQYLDRIQYLMKQRRVALRMKQTEAARRAGINLRTLQQFEQTGSISLLRLLKLMVTYRMDRSFLRFLDDRSGWSIEELQRAETRKTVR